MRDGFTESEGPNQPASAHVEANGSENYIDGEVVVKVSPTSDNGVEDPCSPGGPASMAADASSPSSVGRKNSLRRSASTIANLRAAFEHKDASETPIKRFDKSPSRSFSERLENISTLSREKDAEIARLEEQLAEEIEKRVSCQSRLEAQLKVESETRRKCQERCEMLEKKIEEGQAPPTHMSKEELKESNGISNGGTGEADTRSMQWQLNELKRSISTTTRVENQVSDSVFAQEIAKMHHELQNFVVNTFRRVKLLKTPEELCATLEIVATTHHLEYLRPLFMAFEPSMKLAALQATAVCYIMEVFQEPLLFGLPEQSEWRVGLQQTVKTLPSILAPATFNKWRYLTLDAVRQSGSIEDSVHLAASRISQMICVTLAAITDVQDLSARASSLNSIVLRAVRLSHLFKVQLAQYEFALPVPGTPFQPDLMEDHIVENETVADLSVVCATFPSVIKYGGENGDNSQLSNVVVKSKVLCKI